MNKTQEKQYRKFVGESDPVAKIMDIKEVKTIIQDLLSEIDQLRNALSLLHPKQDVWRIPTNVEAEEIELIMKRRLVTDRILSILITE